MKLIAIILFLVPVVVARHNHRTVLESIFKSKDNLYAKVDSDVQNVMNNLFDGLNLAPTFLEKSRIRLMLTMHYDLNSMAEKNYEVFEKMEETARPDTGNESSNGLALFKLIEKTLEDKSLNLTINENKMSHKLTIDEDTIDQRAASKSSEMKTSSENISPSEPVFADSREFKKFIKDFIKKVDKLNETDFSKSTPLLPPIRDTTTQPFIDFWEPSFDDINATRRIFQGKRSRAKTYPFVVSVHLMDTFVCAGSILSRDLILTAASCLQILHNNRFFKENPNSVYVRIGSDYFSRRGELIAVLETFFHPSYDPRTLANNLVLLRLTRQISFRRKEMRVKRIKFDRSAENLSTNTDGIIVIGWGSRKHSNVIDQYERMMISKLEVYQVDDCAQIYSRQYVTYKHFCAGFTSKGGGACNKDLGGPGITGGILVGVISFGAPLCGALDAPTVFTKVGYYANWIDSVIEHCGPSVKTKTTIAKVGYRYFIDPDAIPKTTRGFLEPVLMYTEEPEREEETNHVVERRTTHRTQFDQLFPNTPTTRFPIMLPIPLLRSIIYEDYGIVPEDVNDMFKTTRKAQNPMEHPLMNKSLVPIPGVHTVRTISTQKKKYSTIRLTTFGGMEPSPDLYNFNFMTSPPPPSPPRLTGAYRPTSVVTPTYRIIDILTEDFIAPKDTWPTMDMPVATTEPFSEETKTLTTELSEPVYIRYREDLNKTLRFKDYYN